MFLNSKKILKIIIPIIILITIGYFVMIEISILKKPNKNYIINNQKFTKSTLSSKKVIELLNEIMKKDYKSFNDNDWLIIFLINKYIIFKVLKGNIPKYIKRSLLCGETYMNNCSDISIMIMKDFKSLSIPIYLTEASDVEKIQIINYFMNNNKKVIYNKYLEYKYVTQNLNDEITNLNDTQKLELYKEIKELHVVLEPIESLLNDKEFQVFLDEYTDIS
jgi:hypothetical protein